MDAAPPTTYGDRFRTVSRIATGGAVGLLIGLLGKELGLRMFVSYWGPISPLVFVLMVLCAIFWLTPLRRFVGAVAIVLTLAWLVVAFTPMCEMFVGPLVRTDKLEPADAIFVLSSSVQVDDEPSPTALARATKGLELLGSGLAPRLLLSELPPPSGSYKEYVSTVAHKMGIAHAKAIDDVGFVGNTHDEAQAVAALFAKNGWKKLLLVTSPTHSRRAAATFEKAGIPVVISVPAVDTLFDIQRLDRSDDRLLAFSSIVHEWLGWMVYRARGWR